MLSFTKKQIIKVLKRVIYLLSTIFPNTFSKMVYQLIINPRKKLNKPNSDQLNILKKSTQVKFSYKNYTIKTYQWGSGKKRILLVHGWEGQASSFYNLIDRLNSKEYTIYAFDAPSHGYSDRTKNSFIDFIQIMPELFNKFSPHILITHSFGAVPATYSLSLDKTLQIEKFIMFAPPNKFSDRVDDVIEISGISKKVKKPLINKIETEFSLPFKTLNISNFIKRVNVEKALILHDLNDKVCSVQYSREIYKNWPVSQFEILEGTGHSKILRANISIDKTINFISKSN